MYKHRLHLNNWLWLVMVLLCVACKNTKTQFSYYPTEPRAGESVRFSNSSDDAEEWYWTFGDGSSSASKSPSKVYRKPGTYTVILKADDKNSRTCTKTITVHDTIPAIAISDTVYGYYQPLTFSADVYNPYGYTLSYRWSFPEGTIFLDESGRIVSEPDLTAAKHRVCLSGKNVNMAIHLSLTQGPLSFELDTSIFVRDVKAPSILMVNAEGTEHKLIRQRLYTYAVEDASELALPGISQPTDIAAADEQLFVFDAGTQHAIYVYSLTDGSRETILTSTTGFNHGIVQGAGSAQRLLWTDATTHDAYSIPTSVRNATLSDEYCLQKLATIGLTGSKSEGVQIYNGNYAWVIENEGICVYTTAWTLLSNVLSEYHIDGFAIDPLAKKIYFLSPDAGSKSLYVANIDGTYVEKLSDGIINHGLYVDNQNNRIFFTHESGVRTMQLIQTRNNYSTKEFAQINELKVTALTIDNIAR